MKQKRFCPGCGKSINKNEGFCIDCKPRKDIEFKDIRFDYCTSCGAYFFKNKWQPSENLNEAISHIVKESVKQNIKKITPNIPDVTIAPGVNVNFTAEAVIDDEEYELPGRFLSTICPKCSKAGTTYIEGILQLRNPKPDVKKFIERRIKDSEAKGVFANKVVEVKGGIDYTLTSKKFLRKLGKELKKRFEGELKESPQVFSYDRLKSKDIHRLNVLFRCE